MFSSLLQTMNPNYGKNVFGEMFIMTYANFFLSSTNVVSALYSIRRNWLRRRKAVQLIAQDQKRIKAEIRAGRSIEAAIVLTV